MHLVKHIRINEDLKHNGRKFQQTISHLNKQIKVNKQNRTTKNKTNRLYLWAHVSSK